MLYIGWWGRYDNPIPYSTLSPSKGLWIRLQETLSCPTFTQRELLLKSMMTTFTLLSFSAFSSCCTVTAFDTILYYIFHKPLLHRGQGWKRGRSRSTHPRIGFRWPKIVQIGFLDQSSHWKTTFSLCSSIARESQRERQIQIERKDWTGLVHFPFIREAYIAKYM